MENTEIVGQVIKHKTLGDGTVAKIENGYLTVRFGGALKTFVYPDAFIRFLSTDNEVFKKQIEKDLAIEQIERDKKDAQKKEEEKFFSHGIVIPGRSLQQEEEGKDSFNKEETEEEV